MHIKETHMYWYAMPLFREIGYTRLIDDIDIRFDDTATVPVHPATKRHQINCITSTDKSRLKYGNNGIKCWMAVQQRKFRFTFNETRQKRKMSSAFAANVLVNDAYILITVMESSVELMWQMIEARQCGLLTINLKPTYMEPFEYVLWDEIGKMGKELKQK